MSKEFAKGKKGPKGNNPMKTLKRMLAVMLAVVMMMGLGVTSMAATPSADGKYTIFEFNNQRIRFITSDKLERYTKIVEWDNGYLVVMAKYKEMPEVEEYIDLIPILDMLYYDTETFLKPIKEVRIDAA